MPKMRIYIGGVGGVGKTTVGKELAKRQKLHQFSGSEIMMLICKAASREELESISADRKLEIERINYPDFLSMYEKFVVDGHCELLPEQAACFDMFVFLTAPVEEIIKRRKLRNGRARDTNLFAVEQELLNYKMRVLETERACGVHFVEITNTETVENTCASIEKMLM